MVFGGPEAMLLLLITLVADAGLGGIRFFHQMAPGPARIVRSVVVELDRRLNRPERGDTALLVRGAVVSLGIALTAGLLGWVVAELSRSVQHGLVFEVVVLFSCLSGRLAWNRAHDVRIALGDIGLESARAAAAVLTRRDVDNLDQHGLARVAVESLPKAFSQDVVAPAFWYILLGLPGALVWTVVNSTDGAIGHRSPRYEPFGSTAARLDDALHFVPARLAGCLLVLASVFVGSANPLRALRTMMKDARFHPSLNNGWPLAAVAGALNLALLGPWRQGSVSVREVWIGHGRARAGVGDIDRAMALYAVAALLLAAVIGLLMAGLASL